MEKVILHGVGNIFPKVCNILKHNPDICVVEVWDTDTSKIGETVCINKKNLIISYPHMLESYIPVIITSVKYENEIRKELMSRFNIPKEYIKEWLYCAQNVKENILRKYNGTHDWQLTLELKNIQQNGLHIFNNGLYEKYIDFEDSIPLYRDKARECWYSLWKGNKLYLKRSMDEREARRYLCSICCEQDTKSPHSYTLINDEENSVVIDAGAAEGIFSLEHIDKAKKLYIVESDTEWIEALQWTFEPYKNKIQIVQKFLSDHSDDYNITVDDLIGDIPVSLIKMDIEGDEIKALKGADRTLSKNQNMYIALCTYHNADDAVILSKKLLEYHFCVHFTDGYMFFPMGNNLPNDLRHVLLIGKKSRKETIFVWGAGHFYQIFIKALLLKKCQLNGILDSRFEEIESTEKILDPRCLINEDFDYVVVMAKKYKNICEEYIKYGLPREKLIILWKDDTSCYDFIDTNYINLIKKEEEVNIYKTRISNLPYELNHKSDYIINKSEDLLQELIVNHKSLSRFGDGEFEMMRMRNRPWFQRVDEKLSKMLKKIIDEDMPNLCVAIPDNFGSLDHYTEEAADGIRTYMTQNNTREHILKLIPNNRIYYNAYVTRPYIIYRNKRLAGHIFSLWKELFKGRNLLVVEGEFSRIGVGNDLFKNVSTIRRILCPSCDAYRNYDVILETVLAHVQLNDLILISLGPTATVLAYDLASMGYQAIDIGQIDNEYEWYRRGVEERVAIPGKMVAELSWGNRHKGFDDPTYINQVLCKIK